MSVLMPLESQVATPEDELAILLSGLKSDPKYWFSLSMYDKVKTQSLSGIINLLHVPVSDDCPLEELLSFKYIPDSKKLQVVSALQDKPYFHDTSHLHPHPETATNTVLAECLSRLHCAIVDIDQVKCLLVGSLEGLEYFNKRDNAANCPIQLFFEHSNQSLIILCADPKHIEKINLRKDISGSEQTFNISTYPALSSLFQEALDNECYRFQFTMDATTQSVLALNSSGATSFEGRTQSFIDKINHSSSGYILRSMSSSYHTAKTQGSPYTLLLFNNKNKVAYTSSEVIARNRIVISLTLLPHITDQFCTKTPDATDMNISKIIHAMEAVINENKPLIISVAANYCEQKCLYAIVSELLSQSNRKLSFINEEQFLYEGNKLIAIPMATLSQPSDSLQDVPYLYGLMRTKEDIGKITGYIDNLHPIIAITKAPIEQMPHEVHKFAIRVA